MGRGKVRRNTHQRSTMRAAQRRGEWQRRPDTRPGPSPFRSFIDTSEIGHSRRDTLRSCPRSADPSVRTTLPDRHLRLRRAGRRHDSRPVDCRFGSSRPAASRLCGHCIVLADSAGGYVMRGLRPGEYRVSVGDLSLRRIAPVQTRVVADSTVNIDFHLRPGNPLMDCLDIPTCAPILSESAPASALTDGERLLDAAFAATIAAETRGAVSQTTVFCLTTSDGHVPPAVIDAIRSRVPDVHFSSGCEIVTHAFNAFQDTITGPGAFKVNVASTQIVGDSATSVSSFTGGPRSGSGWACTYRRSTAGWRATNCVMTWIS